MADAEPKLGIHIAEDRITVTLNLVPASGGARSATFTLDQLTSLTTDANAVVAPIHPKAMPAILTTPQEFETWLTAPAREALELQRPLPDGMLGVVAKGAKQDGGESVPTPGLLL